MSLCLRGIKSLSATIERTGNALMQQPVPPIHIIVLVTQEDMVEGIARLLQSAGITVTDSDLDEIVSCVRENAPLIYPAHEDGGDAVDDILSFARCHQKSAHCCIVSSKNFIAIREDLKKQLLQPSKRRSKQGTLGEIERDYIVKTLDETNWQYKTAAKILGINRSTLYRKLKKYGLFKNGQKPW